MVDRVGPEISVDPAVVLSEVYGACPRMLSPRTDDQGARVDEKVYVPKIGRCPTKLQELAGDAIDQLPDHVKALLVKLNIEDAAMTVWLWDEANEIDRPIGPIDLTRYTTGSELREALETLCSRIGRVLAADWN